MIDIENKVYNEVVVAIRSAFNNLPHLSCYGEYVETPASFPCVTLVEDDNRRLRETDDGTTKEHYAKVTYTCNIYTNDENKKALAKEIAQVIDNKMAQMNFTRTIFSQVPNIDRTIYRIVLKYEAIVDEGKTSGEDIVHTIYKS